MMIPRSRHNDKNNIRKMSRCSIVRWPRVQALLLSLSLLSIFAFSRSSPFVSAFTTHQSTRRPTPFLSRSTLRRDSSSSTTSLNVYGKTGGTLIETIDAYEGTVLNTDSDKPIMVFFTAPWCGPCRLSVPAVKDVIKDFAGQLECVEVCTDDLPEVAAESGVVSIPTIQIYSQGAVVDTIVGCVAKTVLASSVEKVLEDIQQQVGKKNQ